MVFKAGEGAGASGSFFFFSHDNKFLIKTMNSEEKDLMLCILDDYIIHIKRTNNKSLLARIYGIFSIKTNYFNNGHFMVMQNTAQMKSNQKGNKLLTFDLKGSSIARKTHLKYNNSSQLLQYYDRAKMTKRVLKDINFLELDLESPKRIVRLD